TIATFSLAGTYVLQLVANDGLLSSTDTVIVTVNRANLPPVADSQTVVTDEDTPLDIVLTGSDPDGDTNTFSVVTLPQHGTLTGTAPYLHYAPYPNENGADSFSFKVNDGALDSSNAIVTIII